MIRNKLFEEIDKPNDIKIVLKDKIKGIVEIQNSWITQITGFKSFPSGIARGRGNSKYLKMESISNWHSILLLKKVIRYLL